MIPEDKLKPGLICRHHSGRMYTVIALANGNAASNDLRFPYTVVYIGANGNVWSRPVAEFMEKFSVLHDGTDVVPTTD